MTGAGRAGELGRAACAAHRSQTRYLHPMTDWAPIIFAALGSGALGSIITIYGTQTRERVQARAQAREAIRQVQNFTFPLPTHEQLTAALDQLETSAMLARLPKQLTGLKPNGN